MSRILRRPMFRGGPVSSYGTGIAAPLVPGYQGGGQIGGGIIHGKPMADGRYGFQDVKLFDVKDSIGEIETGGKITEKNVPDSSWENLVELEKFEAVPKYDEDFLQKQFGSFVKGVERRVGYAEDDAFMTDVDLGMQLQPPVHPDDSAFWKIYNEDPDKAYEFWKNNISTWGTKQEEQMKHAKEIGANVDYGIKTETSDIPEKTAEQLEIERLNAIIAGGAEEKPEVDAKTMVAENKKLFAELLGVDKARGSDISDMLLGFAGAEGDDTWSKFKSFTRDEAKRPSKRQKIDETAAGLAIQDYIAGKRSKENIELMTSKMDREYDKKLKQALPSGDDSLNVASMKLQNLDVTPNSFKGIKFLIGSKDKTTTGDLVYNVEGLKMEDFEKGKSSKILKKLKPGYNIIDDGGVKRIIKYDGSGSLNGVETFTISEFWNQTS